MPVYSGKFHYLDAGGAPSGEGLCQLSFDEESCVLAPASGAPLVFDLGDIDGFTPGELDLELALYTGARVKLRGFGGLFSRMSGELLAAWRDRTARCMLLGDLEETARFTGAAALGAEPPARAELRLYRTNLAVIPLCGRPLNWRLADVDAVRFDEGTYSVVLEAGAERLVVSKLAKKTEEFAGEVRRAVETLRAETAAALQKLFPFLTPDALRQLLAGVREGRPVRLKQLAAIHARLPGAFLERAVDRALKPYFEALRARAVEDGLIGGFKFIREEEAAAQEPSGEEGEEESGSPVDAAGGESSEEYDAGPRVLFWLFFPIAGTNLVAWEATTGSGRATYVFRAAAGETGAAVARITRALALVNFRREPVYLPADALDRQPRYRRYLVACRKLPELRELRAAYVGRALHTSPDAWSGQLDSLLRS